LVFPAKFVFWKLMVTSRIIGYQEKSAKQTTAPSMNR